MHMFILLIFYLVITNCIINIDQLFVEYALFKDNLEK